jgi:hypothetical protein
MGTIISEVPLASFKTEAFHFFDTFVPVVVIGYFLVLGAGV